MPTPARPCVLACVRACAASVRVCLFSVRASPTDVVAAASLVAMTMTMTTTASTTTMITPPLFGRPRLEPLASVLPCCSVFLPAAVSFVPEHRYRYSFTNYASFTSSDNHVTFIPSWTDHDDWGGSSESTLEVHCIAGAHRPLLIGLGRSCVRHLFRSAACLHAPSLFAPHRPHTSYSYWVGAAADRVRLPGLR